MKMNELQRKALKALAERYNVPWETCRFASGFDLPDGWVHGWVGPIHVGCSPLGHIYS